MTKPQLVSHQLYIPPEARKRHIAMLGSDGMVRLSPWAERLLR